MWKIIFNTNKNLFAYSSSRTGIHYFYKEFMFEDFYNKKSSNKVSYDFNNYTKK